MTRRACSPVWLWPCLLAWCGCASTSNGMDASPLPSDATADASAADAADASAADTAVDAGPADAGPLRVVSLSATSFAHACAALSDGTVRCWGVNDNGQLGVEPAQSRDACVIVGSTPSESLRCERSPRVVAGLTDVVAVSVGNGTSCALKRDGSVWCWGLNDAGELGQGSARLGANPTPVRVNIPAARQLSVGAFHACAVLNDDTVRCWGSNAHAQVGLAVSASPMQCNDGDKTTGCAPTPVAVPGLTAVARVAAGRFHTCAALRDGSLYCWGLNQFAELGLGRFDDPERPVETPQRVNLTEVNAVGAGNTNTCAVRRDGSLHCWGFDDIGQISGAATTTCNTVSGDFRCAQSPQPLPGVSNARAVSVGRYHTCFATADGAARCMGRNDSGQIGQGSPGDTCVLDPDSFPCVRAPRDPGVTGVVDISVGNYHSCALLDSGAVRCWGRNEFGQVGDGTTTDRNLPVAVAIP